MKKFFLAGISLAAFCGAPAFAADVPVKGATTPFSWTGCYLGANAGGGWGRARNLAGTLQLDLGSPETSGFIGGGQIGCDYQAGAWVLGVEGVFDWASIQGTESSPFDPTISMHNKTTSFVTATARVGYAFDRSLLYVKGGGVKLNDRRDIAAISPPAFFDSTRGTVSGWTAGIGFEHMFAPNWSAKIEYDYLAPRNQDGVLGDPILFKNRINIVLVGLNYRFGGR